MNRDNQKDPSDFHHPGGGNNVEQSWIVLDDATGWGGNSRPPTTSPSRQQTNTRTTDLGIDEEEEEEEELASRIPRRIAMDRDVREALELAERSLEMAGTLDEFSLRSNRGNSDDDASTVRSSPASKTLLGTGGIFVDDIYEDKYNGRAPPTITSRRNNGGLIISTDAEHVAFQNIRMMAGPRSDTPVLNVPPPQCSSVSPASSGVSNPYWPSQDAGNDLKRDEEEGDLSFFQWAFGISTSSNFVPLVFSHVVTLLVGFYIGSRRSSPTSSANATSVVGSPGSPQCSTSATPT